MNMCKLIHFTKYYDSLQFLACFLQLSAFEFGNVGNNVLEGINKEIGATVPVSNLNFFPCVVFWHYYTFSYIYSEIDLCNFCDLV